MDRYVENQPAMIQPSTTRGGFQMDGAKANTEVGNNRRALRDIKNFMVAPFPRASIKSKPAVPEKSRNCEGHRPITRRFAASLANKQLPPQESSKRNELANKVRSKNVIPTAKRSENVPVIDVDEDMEVIEPTLPTLERHAQAIPEEVESMHDCNPEEIDMEDVIVEPVSDIDSCDSKNPLAVVDYVEEIYAFYRQAESSSCVSPNYMSHQSDINEKMRGILIDWLIEVHYKFELMDETLFLTVNLIDRFLERQSVVRKKLQLVGVTAMLLACKYEEVSVPVVEDLILISDKAYTRDEVLAMEKLMINTLQFNLSVPTTYVFMKRFLKAAQSDKTLELLSFFMIELCLVEYEMLKFSPSLLAAAAIYTAQCTLKGFRHWNKTSEWHTRYTEEQLQECSKMIVDFHQKAGMGRLTGVHRKYSISKFGFAAKAEPARFLLMHDDSRMM